MVTLSKHATHCGLRSDFPYYNLTTPSTWPRLSAHHKEKIQQLSYLHLGNFCQITWRQVNAISALVVVLVIN